MTDLDGRPVGRCTLLVAAAGYGKATTIERWLAGETADRRDLGAGLGPPYRAAWLVVDGGASLDTGAVRALARQVGRLPAGVRVVITTGYAPPGLGGGITVRTAADLALDRAAVAALLAERYGRREPETADEVYRLTAGWPALVDLVGADPSVPADPPADHPVARFVEERVTAVLPQPWLRFVRQVAEIGPVDEELCRRLGYGCAEALRRAGLLVDDDRPEAGTGSWWRLVPLVARVVRARRPLPRGTLRRVAAAAGCRYLECGMPRSALAAVERAGPPAAVAALLRDVGFGWVRAGGAAAMATAIGRLPAELLDTPVRLLLAEALTITGDEAGAGAVLEDLAGRVGPGVPGVAWRLGALRYLRGEYRSALAALDGADRAAVPAEADGADGAGPAGADLVDLAMIHAWSAAAYWALGLAEPGADRARRALAVASRVGDPRALAAGHVALALHAQLAGDRLANAGHYRTAMGYAEAAGDLVQVARIRGNLASALLEEGRYPEAAAEGGAAVAASARTGYSAVLVTALCNEAQALIRIGRLDEAAAAGERALRVLHGTWSRKVAYPLICLGDVHRLRGRYELARAAYGEALRYAEAAADLQGVVPALTGLIRLMPADDGVTALVERVRAVASGPFGTAAWLVTGWVALARGDRDGAAHAAARAAEVARGHRDHAGLAEAVELRAGAAANPNEARRAWREAAETWRVGGARLDVDRITAILGDLPGATPAERAEGALARERLAAGGVAVSGPGGLPTGSPTVVIQVLGRFEIAVDGTAVPTTAWQSRKARDLLRLLIARRGRPVTRDELGQLLWGDDDPARVAHRLSVALSTVRAVLDPRRTNGALLVSDQNSVALDPAYARIDLEAFLAESSHGLRLLDRGAVADAQLLLASAERRYRGDFLADDPYEDWTVPAREEARAAYLRTVRALAHLAGQAGRTDDAVRYLLKVLDRDPYDDDGHRRLVAVLRAGGRHGEARRALERYHAAMLAIGVHPGTPGPT